MTDDATETEGKDGDEAILDKAKADFDLCVERENEYRVAGLEDIKFARLDDHWPDNIRQSRELEHRPCLTIPILPPVIRQVVNDARQNKPAIAVHPVDDSADPDTAEILNGLIRNIEQSSDAEVAYDTALEFAVTSGLGYFRINTRYATDDAFDQDLTIERIANPFSVYGDPHSTAADSSDWNIAFVRDTIPKAEFEARWNGAEAVDWKQGEYADLKAPWMEGDQVAVVEYWTREEVSKQIVALSDGSVVDPKAYQEGLAGYQAEGVTIVGAPRSVKSHKVMQHIMTGAEVLESNEWAGKYIPIVPVFGEDVFIEGKRHLRGIVRSAKDAQRMFNYWRTTTTELVALAPKAPWIGAVGQFETDAARWATANTENHPFLEYDAKSGAPPPQRQPFAGVPAGALQEALNASDDVKRITGIYDASLGAKSNETSGKAIMARQREGDVSTFHYIDNLSRAIRHAGRILIDLIPKVYSTPRVLRVLGPDGKAEVKPVNQPTQVDEKDPETGQVQQIQKIYDLTAGKYDLTVKAGPSFTSRREEAATQMIALIQAQPGMAPLIGDILVQNLDWPGADEIAERLKAMLPPQLKGENPEVQAAQQQIAQMGEALKQATEQLKALQSDRATDVEKLKLEQVKARGSALIEAEKLKVDQFNAETNRMKAIAPKGVPYSVEEMMPVVAQALQQIFDSPDILKGDGAELPESDPAHEMMEAPGAEVVEVEPDEPMEPQEYGE